MKKVIFAAYETPLAEEIEMKINGFICQSTGGDGEGGGNDDYEHGGNV